jgi:RHS repeat-associated protein
MIDWIGETTYELDILGRIKRVKDHKGDIVSYQWGLMNEKEMIKYPDGSTVNYEHDINGRIKKVIAGENVTEYEYNPIGTISKELLPNGLTTTYSYDILNRMTKLTHYSKNKEILDERTFEYDGRGSKVKRFVITNEKIREENKNYESDGNTTYEYDELNQLAKVTNSYGYEVFAYDDMGNRIKKIGNKGNARINVEYTYDELNRLVKVKGKDEELIGYKLKEEAEFEYDARGNMIRIQSSTGENIGEYIYDSTNRLIRTTTYKDVIASYLYNGVGRRVKKEIGNDVYEYIVDVTTPYNDILVVNKDKYIYGTKLIGTKQNESIEKLYLHDEMGSVIRTTNDKGVTEEIVQYNTFGKRTEFIKSNIKDNILKSFTGYEQDKETGIDFVQARYYMNDIGRFVEEDTNKGEIENQASLNWYIHCYNNALIYIDRDGHKPVYLEKQWRTSLERGVLTGTSKQKRLV